MYQSAPSYLYPKLVSDIDSHTQTLAPQLLVIAKMTGISPEDDSSVRRMGRHFLQIVKLEREIKRTHPDIFESQRRGIGEAHKIQGEILLAMKEAVALRLTNPEEAARTELWVMERFKKLQQIDMPEDQRWMFDAQVGQEIAELHFHNQVFFDTLFHGTAPSTPAFADALGITPQAWLAGLGDTVGELSKSRITFFCSYDIPLQEKEKMLRRFVAIGRTILDFLNLYIAKYPLVIDNDRRRFYKNKFRGKVLDVEFVLLENMKELNFWQTLQKFSPRP